MPRPREPKRRVRRRDEGNVSGVEAVFVSMLVFSGVAVYVAVDPHREPSVNSATRDPVEDLAADLVLALGDVSAAYYGSQLSRVIARGVLDDTTPLERIVTQAMPPGSECRVWIDNGHARRQMGGDKGRMSGETISAAKWWRPTWAYSFSVPSLDVITPLQPLDVQGFSVSRGALVKEQGVPVQVTVTTDQGNYSKATLTSIRDGPSASLLLRNSAGGLGLSYFDPFVSATNTTVWNATGTTSLPSPSNFEVPVGTSYLTVAAAFTGDVDYLMTFSSGFVQYPLVIPAAGNYSLTIPEGTAGTWIFTGNGTISGGRAPPSASVTVKAWTAEVADWTFVLSETGGKALPEGANVTVRFPYGFTGITLTNTTQPGWRNVVAVSDDLSGVYVTTELDSPLANASRNFTIHAAKPDVSERLYLVQAHLSNGTEGHATFLLSKGVGALLSSNPIQRTMYLNVPSPLAAGENSTWGILFAYPSLQGVGSVEHVTRVDVQSTNGAELFQGVTGSNWTRLSDSHLQWRGDRVLGPNRGLDLVFGVQAHNNVTPWEPGMRLPVDFTNGDHFDLQDRAQPYVYTNAIPPSDLLTQRTWGYLQPDLSGVPPMGEATYNMSWVARGLRAEGKTNYTVSTFAPLTSLLEASRVGLARSQLNLSKQEARIGEAFNVSVDFRGLFDQVNLVEGVSITGWNVEVRIFDPTQPFQPFEAMVPSYHGRFGANGTLNLTLVPDYIPDPLASGFEAPMPADITHVAAGTIPFVPPRGAFYGPHAIIAQANFVVNDALGNNLLQSARLLAVLDVLPDGGQSGGALYWASLECWLPDW